jgi:hypothetical protein
MKWVQPKRPNNEQTSREQEGTDAGAPTDILSLSQFSLFESLMALLHRGASRQGGRHQYKNLRAGVRSLHKL